VQTDLSRTSPGKRIRRVQHGHQQQCPSKEIQDTGDLKEVRLGNASVIPDLGLEKLAIQLLVAMSIVMPLVEISDFSHVHDNTKHTTGTEAQGGHNSRKIRHDDQGTLSFF